MLIVVARKISISQDDKETEIEYKTRRKTETKEQWKKKVMHGQFVRQTCTDEIKENESWLWSKNDSIERRLNAS